MILVIPSAAEGTKWEINYLKENSLLPKCVFIMPPSSSPDIVEGWHKAEHELPIKLPSFSAKGLLFTVENSGEIRATAPLNIGTVSNLASSLKQLFASPVYGLVQTKLSDNRLVKAGTAVGLNFLIAVLTPIVMGIIVLIWFLITH